jgi:hypothetical protein
MMMNKIVRITGVTDFIGSHLTELERDNKTKQLLKTWCGESKNQKKGVGVFPICNKAFEYAGHEVKDKRA